MTGEELYQLYVEAMETQGTAVDSWEDLDYTDHAAWSAVAEQVRKV